MITDKMIRSRNLGLAFVCLCAVSLFLTMTGNTYLLKNLNDIAMGRTPPAVKNIKQTYNLTHDERILFDPRYPVRDRIIAQIKHIPRSYRTALKNKVPPKPKVILRYSRSRRGSNVLANTPGNRLFGRCPVNRCEITYARRRIKGVDAVLFDYEIPHRYHGDIPQEQVWILHRMESPRINLGLEPGDQFNWSISYRHDSTIPIPGSVFLTDTIRKVSKTQTINYAANKSKKIVWFVSNCDPTNNRMDYAKKLSKHIPVDRFGRCGKPKCAKSLKNQTRCRDETIKEYKFYLAFENSNCRYYITEKLFINSYNNGVLPIVMGAPKEDYERIAPPHSFIHVDDFKSPSHLAEYLKKVDTNDTLYNSYFEWVGTGRLRPYQHNFWCQLCSMLFEQDSRPPSWYGNGYKWWRGYNICPANWKTFVANDDVDLNKWREII